MNETKHKFDTTSVDKLLLGAVGKIKDMDKMYGRATLLRAVALLMLSKKKQSGDVIADITDVMEPLGDAAADIYHCINDYI